MSAIWCDSHVPNKETRKVITISSTLLFHHISCFLFFFWSFCQLERPTYSDFLIGLPVYARITEIISGPEENQMPSK